MAQQVTIKINGRDYTVTCEDGQEERLRKLAAYFNEHVCELSEELGQIGDSRLMLLSALTVCDELFEARQDGTQGKTLSKDAIDPDTKAAAARAVDAATERVRKLSEQLEDA